MTRGASIKRTLMRALPLSQAFVLLTSAIASADVQVTTNSPPDSSKCVLASPSAQCGSWTYWAALGALVIGVVIVAIFIVKYLKDAPRFQMEADGRASTGRAGAVPARPLAPPPPGTAAVPARAAAPTAPAAAAATAAAPATMAVAVADPPPGTAASSSPTAAPAATTESPAAVPAERRAPSPRHEPVEPDQATYDRVLAEQLAKGTDRRVAEGRAKAAALKAAREQADA